MKIVFDNCLSPCVDYAHSPHRYHRVCEVKMSLFEFFILDCFVLGGTFCFGYLLGQADAEQKRYARIMKKVDKHRHRY